MKLEQAIELSSLHAEGQQPATIDGKHRFMAMKKTGTKVAREIWSEAAQRGLTGSLGGCRSVEEWRRRWLPSEEFQLVRLPLNAAALACEPREMNLVLKKIHARQEDPIVVDYNRNQVGKAVHGFAPQIIVIDGKHRFAAATLRGESHILAWVGVEALKEIHAFGGGGGGPSPESLTPASGARLVAKKVKATMYNPSARTAGSPATRFQPKPTVTGKGKMLKQLDVDKVSGEFQAACKGGYKPKMDAKAPPGCEDAVQGLKKKYGEGSSSPFKIAWWMKDQGRCG